MEKNNKPKVAVLGGGASGFFCAIQLKELSYNQLDVCIIEKSAKLLSKVKISGGGRCNVTNACEEAHKFVKHYPRGEQFLKKAFHVYQNHDVINWFHSHGVKLKTEEDGRMFPETDDSQTIIDLFLKLTTKFNIPIYTQTPVRTIQPKNGGYVLNCDGTEQYFDVVVLAIGGYPKKEMFEWLHHSVGDGNVIAPVPSLFSFNLPKHPVLDLQGISLSEVSIKVAGTNLQATGPLLFTHWGISGPAVLKLSAWGARILAEKNYQFDLIINWLPKYNEEQVAQMLLSFQSELAQRKMSNKNPFGLTARFWDMWLQQAGIEADQTWAHLKVKQRNVLAKLLCNMVLSVGGKTTYKEEFVTAGGIDTAAINHNTMELKHAPGLYVVGEALNVDGITGGFNFQNAWSTAYIAAKGILSNS